VDPACIALTARIDALRKEGVTERLEKAAVGKSTTVQVKRASLAQIAELDKANAEFQARCSTLSPKSTQAVVVPAASAAPPAVSTAQAASKPAAPAAAVVAPLQTPAKP
jgi:hypothetical protein